MPKPEPKIGTPYIEKSNGLKRYYGERYVGRSFDGEVIYYCAGIGYIARKQQIGNVIETIYPEDKYYVHTLLNPVCYIIAKET